MSWAKIHFDVQFCMCVVCLGLHCRMGSEAGEFGASKLPRLAGLCVVIQVDLWPRSRASSRAGALSTIWRPTRSNTATQRVHECTLDTLERSIVEPSNQQELSFHWLRESLVSVEGILLVEWSCGGCVQSLGCARSHASRIHFAVNHGRLA